eukprot:333073_1
MGNCNNCLGGSSAFQPDTNTDGKNNDENTKTEPTTVAMTEITTDHADYQLATSIQSGIHGCLSSGDLQINRNRSKTMEQECTETLDHKVNSSSSEELFTEYAPVIFAKLRKTFNMTNDTYSSILTGDNNALLSFLSNSKSGQYFFFSHDSQFIIKTMSSSELEFMLSLLPSYYQHMVDQPNSLIARFYGVYRLNKFKINHSNKDISFLISNNVFYSPKNITIVQQYDLKGSTQGRETDDVRKKSGAILKDLNFMKDEVRLHMSKDNKATLFHEQIKNDCEWFAKHLIMDYSLLVGIANVDVGKAMNGSESESKEKGNIFCDYYGGNLSDDGKEIYLIGIIDILQKYNKKKKVARFVKGIKYEQSTLSTVPPDVYAKRFCDFFKDKVS